MALWKATDAAASAPTFTVDVTNGNTGIQAFEATPTGTWGVDTTEARAKNINGHAGWILRTVGSGGRSGRVIEETLVAMGSMTGDSEDVVYPDATITIVTQAGNKSIVAGGGNTATFTVGTSVAPTSATLSYQWQYNNSGTWGSVANGTPANTTYAGATSASLVVTPTTTEANNSLYRVVVSSTGATSVTSANSTLLVS